MSAADSRVSDRAVAEPGETIVAQARELVALRAEVEELRQRQKAIRNHLYCMGGPLNDNILGYSKPQLAVLFRIAELT
jgi:hypothetical protein